MTPTSYYIKSKHLSLPFRLLPTWLPATCLISHCYPTCSPSWLRQFFYCHENKPSEFLPCISTNILLPGMSFFFPLTPAHICLARAMPVLAVSTFLLSSLFSLFDSGVHPHHSTAQYPVLGIFLSIVTPSVFAISVNDTLIYQLP